jgi:glucose-1-phosphate cytidylyltransferase
MKVVILCGGLGTRLREETEYRPKPMVPVGDQPILWHIMKLYAHFGHSDFILCLGYKGDVIKDYFRNYQWSTSDVTLKLGRDPEICYHGNHDEENWRVTLMDTGQNTMTGGRLKRALKHIKDDQFLLTYGDGVADVDINTSIDHHRKSGGVVTLSAVQPSGRFGDLSIDGSTISAFHEKPEKETGYVSGGFFVVDRRVENYLGDDSCVLEREPLERLAAEGNLKAYKHQGFWQCMDTYREQQMLEAMWQSGDAPWKIW